MIRRLDGAAETSACAAMMSHSEPWITLGRGLEESVRLLRDPAREVYVVDDGGAVVGFISLQMRGPLSGYIHTVAVREEARGYGLGTALIAFAERRIFGESPNVFICVSSFNTRAQALYARLGYEKIGVLKDYIVRGHDEWLLRKSIAPAVEFAATKHAAGRESSGIREWDEQEIRDIGYRAADLIARHLTSVPRRSVFRPVPAAVRSRLLNSLDTDDGMSAAAVLDETAALIEPYPFGNGHPAFFGWVNSPPAPIAVFADAVAAAMNPSCAGGNHAAVYVERAVVRWFVRQFGFPSDAMGLLVSGGSMATLTALAVARHSAAAGAGWDVRAEGLAQCPRLLTIYKTREGHSCIQKAAELLGLGSRAIREVPHDGGLRMKPDALDTMLASDIDAGGVPVAVVASAGTVNTGAIDPLDEIADVCARHGVWLHADGAYGAPAMLSARYRDQLAPLARCDSIAIDPHKWLFVPVEAGLVLVRHAPAMRDAFSLVPPYLRTDGNLDGVGGPPWFSEFGFQQTRSFRALKTWMALKQYGRDGYREAIDGNLVLAEYLAGRLTAATDMQVLEPRSLSIVCFRSAPSAFADDGNRVNAFNEQILERVQLGGEAFVTGTKIDDIFWMRACIVNYRTTTAHIDALVDVIVRLTAEASARGL